MNSNFKVHPTFTNYAVSKDGEVYSVKRKRLLKTRDNGGGYLRAVLTKDKKQHTRMVNRLVLQTYDPIENDHLYHAHHNNEVRDDNRLENLEWELIPEHIKHHHKGRKFSEDHKRKLSESHKGQIVGEETRRKLSESGKGRVVSEESRRKMSEAAKIRTSSEEVRKKFSEMHKGKVVSEETKRKISEAKKGKVVSEEHKKKLSESLKGIKRSEETRRKISEARRRRTEHKKGL